MAIGTVACCGHVFILKPLAGRTLIDLNVSSRERRKNKHSDPPVTPFSSHVLSGAYFILYGSPCPTLYQMHLVAQVYTCTHSAIPWVCVTSAWAPGEKTSTVPAVLVLSYRCDALLWHWLSTAQIPVSEKGLDLFVYHIRSDYSRESWFHLRVPSCKWVRLEKCRLPAN